MYMNMAPTATKNNKTYRVVFMATEWRQTAASSLLHVLVPLHRDPYCRVSQRTNKGVPLIIFPHKLDKI